MKRFLLWSAALTVVVLILGAAGFRLWFYSFLQSDQCRLWLNQSTSSALHAKGEFMPLQATPGSLYSDGFIARDGTAFHLMQADQLRADVQFGFWARTCEIGHLEVARLRVDAGGLQHKNAANDSADAESMPSPANHGDPWRGSRLVLRQIVIDDLEVGWSGGTLKGTRMIAWPNDPKTGEWLVNGQGGSLKFSNESGMSAVSLINLPDLRVENFDARIHDGTVFLTSAQLRMGEHGEARLEGEVAPGSGNPAQCHVSFSGIPVGSWLPLDWRARLTGNLSGEVDLHLGPGKGETEGSLQGAAGTMTFEEGELTALPVLDKIANVTHVDGFRQMRIHRASARISQAAEVGHGLAVSSFVAESEGLMKVEGAFTIKDAQIDGSFQVGVAPSTLQWIPGAKERVFTQSHDGYLWAPMHLSGPVDHPLEDLTARLATAAAVQAADSVQQSVRDSAKGVIDLVTPFIPTRIPSLPFLP